MLRHRFAVLRSLGRTDTGSVLPNDMYVFALHTGNDRNADFKQQATDSSFPQEFTRHSGQHNVPVLRL